jgi:UDP-N-acetylglucosamine acyltransferase
MAIDPSARIAPDVELAPDVSVGPGVIIDGPSRIGAGCRLLAHAYIGPYTTMGEDNLIGFGAVIGYDPQDYAFTGGESYTLIGHHNLIREYVTIHRGTKPGSATRVGNHNFLMALSHMAHNSSLGDHVVLVNGALVGGYVEVADRAFISANCLLHQFIRCGHPDDAGRGPASGTCRLLQHRRHPYRQRPQPGGLRRAGFPEQIAPLRQAVRILFGTRMNLKLALERVEAEVPLTPEVAHLLEFIRASKRGVAVGSGQGHDAEL